ncbi:tRNA glutamyl-Q(34) synthetase GluQRS [Psychromonas sp. psych-6C06]|uniref:tRNA glutamyl-Q(34) synthetase GluQRS n=1 Tax=Psychromonas sp. psych-6C06 TaxID=2058089 RepID=UPI000C343B2B|nr:tRNA glutamyl-Q(34) synthetase GluQRS [Psychromonas sp. psych-6C06]PKF61288.1 tRNA glutamyl-Q(34) synthetase GluQRS [Psychromonas sp. psych-6C06]
MSQSGYIGRFAPSPSGSLHFGSLVAALGSYLQAKSKQGKWLVRIEDIDPPREVDGASEDILATLSAYGLHHDDRVIYQSQQSTHYEQALKAFKQQQLSYNCDCTRKIIKQQGGLYLGYCRERALSAEDNALRINVAKLAQPITHFYDLLQGEVTLNKQQADEDFIIKRKDGLYAYNLAVVIDDINQGVTEIVRGADLLPTTGKQICLYQLLGQKTPSYIHLPLVVTEPGLKLSKQNHALAIDKQNPIPTLLKALAFLGHEVPALVNKGSCESILNWAVKNWCLTKVPKQTEIQLLSP